MGRRWQSGVQVTDELRAAAGAFRVIDKTASAKVTKAMKSDFLPMLGREVVRQAAFTGSGRIQSTAAGDQKYLGGANPGIRIGGDRRLSGGAYTDELVRPSEFGAYRELYGRYKRRGPRSGERTEVIRRTTRQFRSFRSKGYFVYEAIAETMPIAVAQWVALISEALEAAIEGRRDG